jgi:hypothetical protein
MNEHDREILSSERREERRAVIAGTIKTIARLREKVARRTITAEEQKQLVLLEASCPQEASAAKLFEGFSP